LTINRSILRLEGETEGPKEVVPLDEYLGIDKLPFKMTRQMMIEVAFWGQNQTSFKMAERILQKIYGVSITDDLIRKVTYYVGKVVYEEDLRRAQDIYKNMKDIPYERDIPGVLYIMTEGAAINTRIKDDEGSTWRENKLGLVFSSKDLKLRKDGETHDILKKEYVSYIGSVNEFKKFLIECAVRNGYGRYTQVVIIGDGATWIRNMCLELFPDAIQILDFFHLKENLYVFAKHLYPNNVTEYTKWAETIAGLLRKSKTAQALNMLEEYKDTKLPPGIVNPYIYLLNNKDKVDYELYRQNGWFIGSGSVESGNKTVLQKRCKQAGQSWDVVNAQYLLTLKAKEESDLWEQHVSKYISTVNLHAI
jgi:hypothetical protein